MYIADCAVRERAPIYTQLLPLLLPVVPPGSKEPAPGGRFYVQKVEATIGFEPMNKGFADPRVRPLRHVAAECWLALEDSNLGSRIQSPLSYH